MTPENDDAAGPSALEGPAAVLCSKCGKNPRARKNASWCRQCYNEAAALYRLRARPRVRTEERECAWRDCAALFTWRSSHPKQVCCSKSHYMQYRYWASRPDLVLESLPAGLKRCSKCKEARTADEFSASQWRAGTNAGQCRDCWRSYEREWRRENKDRRSASSRKARAARLLRKYQAPSDDIDLLIKQQGGVCAICKRVPGIKGFHIDHDHQTLQYRGLLCGNCNPAIGNLRDDPVRMISAIIYVLQARDPEFEVDVFEELLFAVTPQGGGVLVPSSGADQD